MGTVGDLPEGEGVPRVGLGRDGALKLDGRSATLAEVQRALRRPTTDWTSGLPDRPVVLEVPADVRWGVAAMLMVLCGDPSVSRAPVFAVRDTAGRTGGFVWTMPIACLCRPPADARVAALELRPSDCTQGPEEVAAAADDDGPLASRYVALHPDGALSTGAVLAAADAAARTGVHVQLVLDAAWSGRTEGPPGRPSFCVDGRHGLPAPPLPPAPARVRGALAGVTDPGHWLDETREPRGTPRSTLSELRAPGGAAAPVPGPR